MRVIANRRPDRTSFVIAHRLSTILDADLIVYMEHGNVVEQGSHAALMTAKGRHWALYESQFSNDVMAA
jgi:ATP-binding cassette subfamily B multidrug efflux pump